MEHREQEKIDQYLRKQLPPEEQAAFEESLRTNSDLAREVAAHREAIALVQSMGDQVILERIKKAGKKVSQQNNKKNNTLRNGFLFLLLLGVVAFALFYFSQGPTKAEPEVVSSKRIFATNYQAYPLTFGDRGEEDVLRAASIAYGEKDYSKALQIFESNSSNDDTKVMLAKGICHIELKEFEKAIELLSSFVDDPLYGEQARWYLSLAFLQTGALSEAQVQLQYLAQVNHGFQQAAAKKIIEQLKKN